MNTPDETSFEDLLRQAPRPSVPSGLKDRLLKQAKAISREPRPAASPVVSEPKSWFQRWWPSLIPAGLSAACFVALAVQQREINSLRSEIHRLSAPAASEPSSAIAPTQTTNRQQSGIDLNELTTLRETAASLSSNVRQLENLGAENQKLSTELAKPLPGLFTQEEMSSMAEAQERAERINCINQLKQCGLAARIWAADNGDAYPPDVLSMTNELNTPKILHCPSDTSHEAASNWSQYTPANCSYVWYLDPPSSALEPTRVLTRCPIHGTVGLCDGSVQADVALKHPEWLVQRDGKLYLETGNK